MIYYPAALAMTGFAYQQIASYFDRKKYPPPGELIDVGGYNLHIQCQGERRQGIPTVIIETGIFDCSHSWQLVQPEIAKFTQVVTYDRAGYGWSDQCSMPRTFDQMINELRTLLTKKGINPPYILVGHSLGGPIARYYQSQYPEDVVGMVFVDALHVKAPEMSRIWMAACKVFSHLSFFGVSRLLFKCCPSFSANPKWTSEMQKAYIASHWAKSKALYACLEEADACEYNFNVLNQHKRSLKDMRITVISRDPDQQMHPSSAQAMEIERRYLEETNQGHVNESDHARLVIAKGSGHLVQVDRPDIVIEEIYRQVEAAKTKSSE
ncbi:MAG: alpha/beta hydrolase [Parachlamydiaceae bacterium]